MTTTRLLFEENAPKIHLTEVPDTHIVEVVMEKPTLEDDVHENKPKYVPIRVDVKDPVHPIFWVCATLKLERSMEVRKDVVAKLSPMLKVTWLLLFIRAPDKQVILESAAHEVLLHIVVLNLLEWV